jgi:two-component system response regulator FixJ
MPMPPTVFVADDDAAVRESLRELLEAAGHDVRCFASGGDFLRTAPGADDGCLIVDVRMPGIDGLELQDRLRASGAPLPVIVVTGHADVPLAVRAMKGGAVDFVEKPFTAATILTAVGRALETARQRHRTDDSVMAAQARLVHLTPREREVFGLLAAGKPNKVIAHELAISPRTVEIHRARIMEKTHARSIAELVRLAVAAGVQASAAPERQ